MVRHTSIPSRLGGADWGAALCALRRARSAFKLPVVIGFGDLDNEVFVQPNRAAKSLCFFER